MFKIIFIISIGTTLLFSSWLTEENIKNYPTLFQLEELEKENNFSYLEPYTLYKGEIDEFSQDGILWFSKTDRELWHHNLFNRVQVATSEESLYKLESKTPLSFPLHQKIPLDSNKKLYSNESLEEFVYKMQGVIELPITDEGRLIFKHRLLMNRSFTSNENYSITFIIDNKEITKEFQATYNSDKQFLGGEALFASTLKSMSVDIGKDTKSVKVVLDKHFLGNFFFQRDGKSSFLFNHDFKSLINPPIAYEGIKRTDNRYVNSAVVNANEIFQFARRYIHYPEIWEDLSKKAFRDMPYKELYPKELPTNSYLLHGYFLPKRLQAKEREKRIKESLEIDYLTKLNSATFIGIKGEAKKRERLQKELIEEIQFELDDAKTKPDFFQDLKLVAQKFTQGDYESLYIESHTDSRASKEYNLKLSQKRGDAVAVVLESLGIEKEKIKVIPKGKSQLKDREDDEYGHQQNRRVEIYGVYEKKSREYSLVFPLPAKEHHWLRVSVFYMPDREMEMFVDKKSYGTLKFKDSSLPLEQTVTEKMIGKYGIDKAPFIWYKKREKLVDSGTFEFYLDGAKEISFKSRKGEIIPVLLEIRDGKRDFFDEDSLIKLFSLEQKDRAELIHEALFKENQHSNNLYPFKEFLDSRRSLFEETVDKSSNFNKEDLELVPALIENGELSTAIRISKFFLTKKREEASKYLYRLYKEDSLSSELVTLKAYETLVNKDLKHLPFLRNYFYKNTNYKMALFSALGAESSFQTVKIAEKLKLFRLAEVLRSQITQEEFSEDIWTNISHQITSASAVARVYNKVTGTEFTRYALRDDKKIHLEVTGPVTLKIESRVLVNDTQKSSNSWLDIAIGNDRYVAPIYGAHTSNTLILENLQGGIGEGNVKYLTIPQGKFDLTISGRDRELLLGIWKKEIDFKNRYKKHQSSSYSDTLYKIGEVAKDDYLQLVSLLHKYESSADESFAIRGKSICLRYQDLKEFQKICNRITRDLVWERYHNSLSSAGIVRVVSSSSHTTNKKTLLKRQLLTNKTPHTLIPIDSKITYQILKRGRKRASIDIERVSYRYYKQSAPLQITIETQEGQQQFFLDNQERKRVEIALPEEINSVVLHVEGEDIGTFANIVLDTQEPEVTKKYFLTTPTYPLTFVGEYGDLFRVNFENGDTQYFFLNSREYKKRVIRITSKKNRKVQIYRFKQHKFTPYILKAETTEDINEKPQIKEQTFELFNQDSYKKALISPNRCLDYYTFSYQERKESSEDRDFKKKERFLELAKDLSCKREDLFMGVELLLREHLEHKDTSVGGLKGKLYYQLNKGISIGGSVDGIFQDSGESIFNKSLFGTYDFLTTQSSKISLKLSAFHRSLKSSNNSSFIDKDIYSQYKADHKFGTRFSGALSHLFYDDLRAALSLGVVNNEDGTIDNIYSSITTRALFNSVEGSLALTTREYLNDNLRDNSVRKDTLNIDLNSEHWFGKTERWELFLGSRFDLSDNEQYLHLGLRIFFNAKPFYSNSYPATEQFKRVKTLKNWSEIR